MSEDSYEREARGAYLNGVGGQGLSDEAAGGQEDGLRPRLVTTCLADVEPEKVTWLWPGFIPYGKFTILEGDPGLGKSTFLAELAARVSRGEALYSGGLLPRGPQAVGLLSAEDGLADTIAPRLLAAGGDRSLIHSVDGFLDVAHRDRALYLVDDTAREALRRWMLKAGAGLLIIDVLVAYLGGSVDSYRDQDVRQVLRPLAAIAEESGAAIVAVRYLRKTGGARAINSGGGSVGIGGAARSVILLDRDPTDDTRLVLASVKSNLGPAPPSLRLRIVHGGEGGAGRVQWEGVTSETAETLTAAHAYYHWHRRYCYQG